MALRHSYKILSDYSSSDLYKHYIKETGNPSNITKTQYNAIVGEFNAAILDLITLEHYRFMFPRRLGYLRIKKKKLRIKIGDDGKLNTLRMRVDYKATKEMWAQYPETKEKHQKVYHTNSHTDGYNLMWYWDKTISTTKYIKHYTLDINRHAKRRLAAATKDPMLKIDFFE